jgi:phage tail tape-measure protein
MDDKDKGETDTGTDTGTGTAGSTLGGAVAGAVAGTALGVPVVGTVIGALSGAAIGAARKRTTREGEGYRFTKKEGLNDDEAIGKAKSCVEERPQSFQKARGQKDGKGRGQKAGPENRTSIEATRDRQKAWT